VTVEFGAPVAVADPRESFGRGDDVGEQHGREDPVAEGRRACAGQELLNARPILAGVVRCQALRAVVGDEPGVRDVRGQELC
jgi:hypothetical protein